MAYPSWLKRAQVFTTCWWSPACQRVTGTLQTVVAMFLSAWELAAKAAEGPGCFLDWLLWHDAPQLMGLLGHTLPGAKKAQIFIPCEWSAACQGAPMSAKTALTMFSAPESMLDGLVRSQLDWESTAPCRDTHDITAHTKLLLKINKGQRHYFHCE